MASTTGAAAMLLYLVICVRVTSEVERKEGGGEVGIGSDGIVLELPKGGRRGSSSRRRRMYPQREIEPPETWMGKAALVVGTIWFIYCETLGRWPLADLFFGIRHHRRRQGNREVARVYAGSQCLQLKGCKIMVELTHMLRLLTLCFLFSKKPYPVLLETAGFTEDDVLLKELRAGLLKPVFTILRDRDSKSFVLLIRGALSVKDKLTAATGALIPFHHLVSTEGGIHNVIIGYAHSGMLAAARWIAKCSTPCLLRAMNEYPDYDLKIIGHSMGAGIAALLTYILREHEEFSSSTCVAFGPAACMSWELAESGKHFITTVVNATDLVPSFSAVSVDNLRSEIKASSWLTNTIQNTGLFKCVHHFMAALGSCIPFLYVGEARVTNEGMFHQPMPESTVAAVRHEAVASCPLISYCSCCSGMSRSQRAFGVRTSPNEDGALGLQITPENNLVEEYKAKSVSDKLVNGLQITPENNLVEEYKAKSVSDKLVNGFMTSGCEEIAVGEDPLQVNYAVRPLSTETAQEEFWLELNKGSHRHNGVMRDLENGQEKHNLMSTEESRNEVPTTANDLEVHQLYPPGKILHMVAVPALDQYCDSVEDALSNRSIGIYETPREMYGKIRLAETMIDDHYMPRYKIMMELLIHKLKEENSCFSTAV